MPTADLRWHCTGLRNLRQACGALRIHAIGSPFDTKDVLKARGYRWNDGSSGRPKCWWREIVEDAYDEEDKYLRREVYRRDVEAYVQRLTACERFKG